MVATYIQLAQGLAFPEGPAFAPDGTLWGVELKAGCLWKIGESELERISVGGTPNGLTFDSEGSAIFCDAANNAVRRWSHGVLNTVVEADHLTAPNDLAFDADWNLVFTCPGDSRKEPTGTVWCYTRDGDLICIADGMYFPNGLSFSRCGKTLYIAETYRNRIWKGQWSSHSPRWSKPMVFAQTQAPLGPDGLAVDADGNVMAAIYGKGIVSVFAKDGSAVLDIDQPGPNPTNCAIDPQGRWCLVSTEAHTGTVNAWTTLPSVGSTFKGEDD